MDSNSEQNLLPVKGIQLASACAEIYKTRRNDVTLIRMAEGTTVSALFTQNVFAAAPVIVAKQHLESGVSPKYLLINAGNANAGLGKVGEHYARETCKNVSGLADCEPEAVLPFSTGVIGEEFPVEKLNNIIPTLIDNLNTDGWLDSARAIMTTDTVVKAISEQVVIGEKKITITGIAKGSGMIRPDMATMLAFIGTDVAIDTNILQQLHEVTVDTTFNRISVDGDTSTNDASVLMATGQAGNKEINSIDSTDYQVLREGLHKIYLYLAKSIVKDGEGATKFIEVNVKGGKTPQECLQVAYAISNSPLVKTAFFASDPNWGRILAAIGNSGLKDLDINQVRIIIDDVCIVENGARFDGYTEDQGKTAMSRPEICLVVELGRGENQESVWTCDLSHEYVRINAEYRT